MARRTRKWQPIGRRLKDARNDAGLTLSELAKLTGISVASLSRFESDRAEPGFGDVCVIAQQLGWPLLHFATGRKRKGDDTRALATELHFWGLRDVLLAERILLGEVRTFEELFADAIARVPDSRVLEALPGLLLKNPFETQELLIHSAAYASIRRVGWGAEVAEEIAKKLPRDFVQPEASRRLQRIQSAAWKERAPSEPDYIGPLVSQKFRDRVWNDSPPIARRWKIACDISLDQFLERAKSVLSGV
jgi:transcriptional regulator with XRE-family HTH domain